MDGWIHVFPKDINIKWMQIDPTNIQIAYWFSFQC